MATKKAGSKAASESRIEYMPLSQLKPAPRNPKEHAEDDIRSAITRFGFVDPFILNEATGKLVAGHGRLKVSQALEAAGGDTPLRVKLGDDGAWLFPVLRGIRFKNHAEAEAYLLASNRLGEKGGNDEAMLSLMLQEMRDNEVSLEGIGFDGEELEKLLSMETHQLPVGAGQEQRGLNAQGIKGVTSENGVVKTVPLYMDVNQHQRFLDKLKQLNEVWDLKNVSEVVFRAVMQTQP